MYELTVEETRELKSVIEEFSGLTIADAAVTAIVNEKVFNEVRIFGIGDTVTNEVIADAFANALLGRDWPMSREKHQGLDMDAFFASLRSAATEKGWLAQ